MNEQMDGWMDGWIAEWLTGWLPTMEEDFRTNQEKQNQR